MTYPNDEDRFGPITSLWQAPAIAMRDELEAWLPEYLAAHERQVGIQPGSTPTLRSAQIRHAAEIAPDAQLPAAVIWIAGETRHDYDPEGAVHATVQLGVYLVVGSHLRNATGELLHRYVAATRALFLDRTSLRGVCNGLRITDGDFTRIEIRRDGTRQSAALSFEAPGVLVGVAGAGPGHGQGPRPDPRPPLPGDPLFEHAYVDVQPTTNPLDPED